MFDEKGIQLCADSITSFSHENGSRIVFDTKRPEQQYRISRCTGL